MRKIKLLIPCFIVIVLSTSCRKHLDTKVDTASDNGSIAKIESIAEESITHAVVTNLLIPFDQTFLLGNDEVGEQVHFVGQLHLVTRLVPPNPIIPGDQYHITLISNVVALQGVGLTSGQIYQFDGSFQTDQPASPGSSFTFDHIYRLVPPNPILPPNPIIPSGNYRFRYSAQLNFQGVATDASAVGLGIDVSVGPG
jgi:hypothetical protein